MKGIVIVIPTLKRSKGEKTGKLAAKTAGCSVPIRVIVSVDKHRQGFTKTANAGMRQVVDGADICLLNDDVSNFPYGWLEILRRVLHSNRRYGLSCPSGASAASPMNSGRPGMSGTKVVSQASFWCVLLKGQMVKQLGLLDEEMVHYCSDNWYCHRMRSKGWKCVWARTVFLTHRKHGSGMQTEWRDLDRKVYFRLRKKRKK